MKDFDGSVTLENGFVWVEINKTLPMIQSIRYDPTGRGSYGDDLCTNRLDHSSYRGIGVRVGVETDGITYEASVLDDVNGSLLSAGEVINSGSFMYIALGDVNLGNMSTERWEISMVENQRGFLFKRSGIWHISGVVYMDQVEYHFQPGTWTYAFSEADISNVKTLANDGEIFLTPGSSLLSSEPTDTHNFGSWRPNWLSYWNGVDLFTWRRTYGLEINTTHLSSFAYSYEPPSRVPELDIRHITGYPQLNSSVIAMPGQSYSRAVQFTFYDVSNDFLSAKGKESLNRDFLISIPNTTLQKAVESSYINLLSGWQSRYVLPSTRADGWSQYKAIWLDDQFLAYMYSMQLSRTIQWALARELPAFYGSFSDVYGIPTILPCNVTNDAPSERSGYQSFLASPMWVMLTSQLAFVSGNLSYALDMRHKVERVISWLNGTDSNGDFLVESRNKFAGAHVDWAYVNGTSTVSNAFYYASLLYAAKLERRVGNLTMFNRYLGWAEKVKHAINRNLWSATQGHYITCIYTNGTVMDFFDSDAQVYPLLWGIANSSQADAIFNQLSTRGYDNNLPILWVEGGYPAEFVVGRHYDYGDSIWLGRVGTAYLFARKAYNKTVWEHIWNEAKVLEKFDVWYEWYNLTGGITPQHHPYGEGYGYPKAAMIEEAGAFLSHLLLAFGIEVDELGLRFSPYNVPSWNNRSIFTIHYNGKSFTVNISGSGSQIGSILVDDRVVPSLVVPSEYYASNHSILISLGSNQHPYILTSSEEIVRSEWSNLTSKLSVTLLGVSGVNASLEAYYGYRTPTQVRVNGSILRSGWVFNSTTRVISAEVPAESLILIDIYENQTLSLRMLDFSGEEIEPLVKCYDSTGSLVVLKTASGAWANFTLPPENYTIITYWQGNKVNRTSVNLVKGTLLTVRCSVYKFTVEARDRNGISLSSGQIFVTFPNSTKVVIPKPSFTLRQVPNGTYWFSVKWEGSWVYGISPIVRNDENGSANLYLDCNIYILSFVWKDDEGYWTLVPSPSSFVLAAPNGTFSTLSEPLIRQAQNGTWKLYAIYWQNNNIIPTQAPFLVLNSDYEWKVNLRVYLMDWVFKDYSGSITLGNPGQFAFLCPNGTEKSLTSLGGAYLQNGTYVITKILWQGTNVKKANQSFEPKGVQVILDCRVYNLTFSSSFKDYLGADLYVNPSAFVLIFPNGTVSAQLSPSGSYLIQNGTTVVSSVTWQGGEVTSSTTFDAADGSPTVKCKVYGVTGFIWYNRDGTSRLYTDPSNVTIVWANGTSKMYSPAPTGFDQVQVGVHKVVAMIWQGSNVVPIPNPTLAISNDTTWLMNLEVSSLSLAFKDATGAWDLTPSPTRVVLSLPNGTHLTTTAFNLSQVQMGKYTIEQLIWEGNNVIPDPRPAFIVAHNDLWVVNARVYSVNFSSSFKDSTGASYVSPSSFRLICPNGTTTSSLSVGIYRLQNGSFLWSQIVLRGIEIAPLGASFDPAEGDPEVKCRVYDLSVRVVDRLGLPVLGAEVNVYWPNGTLLYHTTTSSDGKVEFSQLPEGRYKTEVLFFGLKSSKEVHLVDMLTQDIMSAVSYPIVGVVFAFLVGAVGIIFAIRGRRRLRTSVG